MRQKKSNYSVLIPILILSFLLPGAGITLGNPLHRNENCFSTERKVDIKIVYKVSITGHLNRMKLKMIIPVDIKERQTVNSLDFSIEPDSMYTVGPNAYALFRFYDLDKSFKIVMKSNITIYKSIREKNEELKADLTKYLIAEQNIESDSPKIVSLAATLKQKSDIETVMKTFDYVKANISYQLNPAIGAEKVLETGVGKCMDYSDLFVALLRANRIPAKSMFGIVVDYMGDNPLHAWSEVYLKKQGWIRFDATTTHSEITWNGEGYKMKISNKYIVLSEGRNDPELHVSQYHYSYNCTAGTEIKVKVSSDVDAPLLD